MSDPSDPSPAPDAFEEAETLRLNTEALAALAADAETIAASAPPQVSVNLERTGDMIGRYQLVNVLGEGGFGTVWRAEQSEPIHREVALKVIKPGMDSREIIARFEAERQALALMDHPNIAGVLDAGTTGNGRPFFVMELVKGVPITDYCDSKQLTIRQRLELFILVCQAVQHAHQKAILHRDLKPSNILVTEIDGKPVPKVIDFGIAKALGTSPEAALQGSLLQTQFGAVIGTPQYMSPEQAGAEPDLDTRSDIYTLGVILFELLTGDTPLSRDSIRKAALDEILRVVREAEPKRPSSRVVPATATSTQTCTARKTGPARLMRSLRGDLDWITLKSLEKERDRRYESASAFAQDLERHLRDEPVEAGPPSVRYRLTKLVRKNKGTFAAAAAIIFCLVTGLVVSAYALLREWQALAELRSTAPTFHDVAKSKLDEGRFDEALEKIGYAIQLDSTNADYRLFRANLLESLQRLAEARAEYQRVITLRANDETAAANLSLCENLLAESRDAAALPKALQKRLLEALIAQGRLVEAGPLSTLFEPDVALAEATIRARLNDYKKQVPWRNNRVSRLPDGTFKVNLSGLALGDLSVLKDLPVSVLNLHQDYFNKNRLVNLGELRGLPLKVLNIDDSNVTDLSPLRGMPLEELEMSRTAVLDLSPLTGMKLRRLVMGYPRIYGRVSDLRPLKGMPLEHLDLENASNIVDITPLRGAPLTYLRLTKTRVADLSPLVGAPLVDLQVSETDVADLAPLAACTKLETLNIYDTKVSDLSPLAKLRLTHLDCHWNKVASLEPLRGQPLSYLNLSRIPASSSAAAIQGNPFKFINLAGHPGIDLGPLAYCVSLEEIVLPSKVVNLEVLRRMPRLLVISDMDGTRTADQFWKAHDAK